jgi:alanyl-tRNA synthetase
MFGGNKKKEEEAKAKAQAEQTAQAMRNMSDQLAEKGKQIADLEDKLDAAEKDAAAKAQAEKALADAKAELAKMKMEAAKAKAAEAAAAAASAKAAAAPAPAPTPAATPAAAPAAAPAAGGLAVGVTAYVRQTGGKNLRLRNGPGLDTNAFAGLPPGTSMTLLEGPVQDDGYPWWRIRTVDGQEGWVAGTELVTSPE